jgi:cytochrome c553
MKQTFIFQRAVMSLILLVSFASVCLVAQNSHGTVGNGRTGSEIVAQGLPNGVVACSRCHGFDGLGDGSGAFPVLTGQTAYYLSSQLRQFACGERKNALMQAVAKGLTPEDIDAVALYYASVRPTVLPVHKGKSELLAEGQVTALIGSSVSRVQACVDCHGPNGRGEAPAVPYLAGQYAHYIQLQLTMFDRGYRKNDQMVGVGHRLSAKEAAAVAEYFNHLPLPLPANH